MIKEPEHYINKLKYFFKIDDNYSFSRIVFVVGFIASILAFNLYIINGYGGPDGVVEGISYYRNANWHLQCGRWVLRYFNYFGFGNLVIPTLSVFTLWISVSFSIVMIAKLFDLKSIISAIVLPVIMIVTPTTIDWATYNSVFAGYSFCIVASTYFVYSAFHHNHFLNRLIEAIIVAVIFGIYQAFVGFIAVIFAMTLIVKLLNGYDYKELLKIVIRILVSGILGSIAYILIMNLEFKHYGFDAASRVDSFSISSIINGLKWSFAGTYSYFIDYFKDGYVFKRKEVYLLLFIIFAILYALVFIKKIKDKEYVNAIVSLFLVLLIPLFSNFIYVLIPFNAVTRLMYYQSILFIPLLMAIANIVDVKLIKNTSRMVIYFFVFYLGWTYIISANATYKTYELAYNRVNTISQSIINDIYNYEEYNVGDPIVLSGFVGVNDIKNSKIANYAYLPTNGNNLVMWLDSNGTFYGRFCYFEEYFGINTVFDIDRSAYEEAINSDEFKELDSYPSNNSIKKISGIVIVKM